MDNSQQNQYKDEDLTDISMTKEEENTISNESDDVEFEAYNDDSISSDKLSSADKINKLKQSLATSDKLKQEYLDGWQRLKADYVNLKKRTDDEKIELGRYAKESFVSDLIPVLESFDMAFANKDAWEKVDPNWRTGVEYIHKQFMETLNSYGLKEVNPVGEIFNPNEYTAIENITTDDLSNDHKVAEVVQKGYKVGERLIKSPKVKVYNFNQSVNN